jgi:hypothetical protein
MYQASSSIGSLAAPTTIPASATQHTWLTQDVTTRLLPLRAAHVELELTFRIQRLSDEYAVMAGLCFTLAGRPVVSFHGASVPVKREAADSPAGTARVREVCAIWHRVSVVLERRSPEAYDSTVSVNGKRASTSNDSRLATATAADIRFGVFFSSRRTGDLDIVYDDVRLTVR